MAFKTAILAAAAVTLVTAGTAQSQSPYAYDWSGFYVGAVVGGALFDTTLSDHDCWTTCGDFSRADWEATGGLTTGYNWQFGAGLLGVEADWNWGDFSHTQNDPEWSQDGSIQRVEWDNGYGTIRARAGLAVDRALLYATGGIAIAKQSLFATEFTTPTSTVGCEKPLPNAACARSSDTQVGIAVGAGAEYAFGERLSLKLDYLFVGLPDDHIDANPKPESEGRGCCALYSAESHLNTVRIGLNYRFGGGPTAVTPLAPIIK
jgi:outer membrane immunogenic protein